MTEEDSRLPIPPRPLKRDGLLAEVHEPEGRLLAYIGETDDGRTVKLPVDSLGRPRKLEEPPPPPCLNWYLGLGTRRYPNRTYAFGYGFAVCSAYKDIVTTGLYRAYAEHLPNDWLDAADGLLLPFDAIGSRPNTYEGDTAYYAGIELAVRSARPSLAESLLPFCQRHGLAALPSGLGWLLSLCIGKAERGYDGPGLLHLDVDWPLEKPVAPLDGREIPEYDALVAYAFLTGAHLIDGVLPKGAEYRLGLQRRFEHAKNELGIHRPSGRPHRSAFDDFSDVLKNISDYSDMLTRTVSS